MGVLGPDDLAAVKALLDAGTGAGQADWAHTMQALLATAQQNQNLLNDLESKVKAITGSTGISEAQVKAVLTAALGALP